MPDECSSANDGLDCEVISEDKSEESPLLLAKKTSVWQKDIAGFLIRLRSEHGLKESGCIEVSDFLQSFSREVAEESRTLSDNSIEVLPSTSACNSLRTAYRVE